MTAQGRPTLTFSVHPNDQGPQSAAPLLDRAHPAVPGLDHSASQELTGHSRSQLKVVGKSLCTTAALLVENHAEGRCNYPSCPQEAANPSESLREPRRDRVETGGCHHLLSPSCGLKPASPHWFYARDGNEDALALYERHYSCYQYRDGRQRRLFLGPGGKTVLLTEDADALFAWRKFISDNDQVGVNCAVFRNEGPLLSSDLIREADGVAWDRWPGERLYTYIDPTKVGSRNPGYCFLCAGWRRCGVTTKGLIIMEILPGSNHHSMSPHTRRNQKPGGRFPSFPADKDASVATFLAHETRPPAGAIIPCRLRAPLPPLGYPPLCLGSQGGAAR